MREARLIKLLFNDGGLPGGEAPVFVFEPGATDEADLDKLASLSCVLSMILRAIL